MFWQIVLLISVLLGVVVRWKQIYTIWKCNLIESDLWNLPFVGPIAHFLFSDREELIDYNKKFSREGLRKRSSIAVWVGLDLCVFITDPSSAQFLLKNCLKKADFYNFMKTSVGNATLVSPVPIWRPRRRIVGHAFIPNHLCSFVGNLARNSALMAERLKSVADGDEFTLLPYVVTYTFNSAHENVFGVGIEPDHPIQKALRKAMQITNNRIQTPTLHSDAVFKLTPSYQQLNDNAAFIDNYFNTEINKRLVSDTSEGDSSNDEKPESVNTTIKKQNTLLGYLTDGSYKEQKLNATELLEEIKVLFFAGTDTTATAVCVTALMMARYQPVQQRVYEEISEVFGCDIRQVTNEDLPRLKYLECVIKESMRLYPVVPATIRKTENDVVLPNGESLPKDTTFVIDIWGMHRDPSSWGADAEQFRPERFLEPLKHQGQYMPFSSGPRNCVGSHYSMLVMKTALVTLLMRYRLEPAACAQTEDVQVEDSIRFRAGIVSEIVDSGLIRIQTR